MLQSVTDNLSGLKTVYTENGTQIRKTADNSVLFSASGDENGNETHNIAGDSITYVYDSEYNSVTGVYTDTVSFEKTGAITSDGVTSNFSTDANVSTETDWFGRVTEKSLDIDIVSDDGNLTFNSLFSLTYADTEASATTKVTSLTSSVTNGTNTVSEQEYYEYDSVGNITGIYKIEENEKIYYNKYYYDEANQIIREDNRLGEFTSTYTYDVGGNIVSRIRYPYTEGEITGLTATETHTYSYDNPQWGDILTAYNGQLSMYKMYNADNSLDGGAEYFWEGTRLIAVRLIEGENETDGETAFMRIIYDSDGEPLGFLLNDAMPFLYTKNILGDITGVVYYENADYLFRYAYDAYGNYELIPPDDSAAAEIMAIMFHSLNPLTYRGYVFTPAIGISHYLGSRFYVPQLCRFMNADVYADTAQGVVGTNMFAYCNNNPVMYIDPDGTAAFGSINSFFQKTIKKLKLVLFSIGMYYDFLIIIENKLNAIVNFIKHKNYEKNFSYEITIDLTVKFNGKTFSKYIYDRFKQVNDDVYEELSTAVLQSFKETTGREFLFSDKCVKYEVKQHVEAYWWAINQVRNKNLMANLYTTLKDADAAELENHCSTVNILEAHPIEEVFSDLIFFEINGTPFGFIYREQELMFLYYDGIRKIYYKTIHDPYYDVNTGKRNKWNAYQNDDWSMKT